MGVTGVEAIPAKNIKRKGVKNIYETVDNYLCQFLHNILLCKKIINIQAKTSVSIKSIHLHNTILLLWYLFVGGRKQNARKYRDSYGNWVVLLCLNPIHNLLLSLLPSLFKPILVNLTKSKFSEDHLKVVGSGTEWLIKWK